MTRNKKNAPSKHNLVAERTIKILALRNQGKTQFEVAKELGIKRSMVADTDRGKYNE